MPCTVAPTSPVSHFDDACVFVAGAAPGTGVLLGSGKLATELDRLDLIDEYNLLVHPRIAGHGPTLYQSGAQHATARADLDHAALQRRRRHALPARPLIQSSLFALSSRACAP